jgi:hypothetical protein
MGHRHHRDALRPGPHLGSAPRQGQGVAEGACVDPRLRLCPANRIRGAPVGYGGSCLLPDEPHRGGGPTSGKATPPCRLHLRRVPHLSLCLQRWRTRCRLLAHAPLARTRGLSNHLASGLLLWLLCIVLMSAVVRQNELDLLPQSGGLSFYL